MITPVSPRNVEEWKLCIRSNEYLINDSGQVMSLKWGKRRLLKPTFNRKGYAYYGLQIDGKRVACFAHILVLEAFVGLRPEGEQTRHLDGNHANNCLGNLCWGTSKENGEDKVKHGTSVRGEAVHCAKLTEEQVKKIKGSHESALKLSRRFDISEETARKIKKGLKWAWL